jgi:hypothetical protein
MSGIIRCKHDCLVKTGVFKDKTVSLTFTDNCTIDISRKIFEDIAKGANFTHIFFSEKIDLETYKKERADFFRNVSSYCNEYFHLIY